MKKNGSKPKTIYCQISDLKISGCGTSKSTDIQKDSGLSSKVALLQFIFKNYEIFNEPRNTNISIEVNFSNSLAVIESTWGVEYRMEYISETEYKVLTRLHRVCSASKKPRIS